MVTLVQAVELITLGNSDLWDHIKAALIMLAVPQKVRDLLFELARRLNIAKAQSIQPVPQPVVTVLSTLAGSKVKLEAPEKFDGNA